jgi:hypothetical protein
MYDFDAESILTELAEESYYLRLDIFSIMSLDIDAFVIVRVGAVEVQNVLKAGYGRVLIDVVKVNDFKRSIPLT